MDIKGHAAIVTGGGSGLGAATAAELAKAGAKVALLDVNMDAANAHAKTIGGMAIKCDVSDSVSAEAAINEAFGAQVMACARALELDEDKLNVNGGAIAIGHPLGATGVRLAITLARELKRAGLRYGIASACIGGGQGIALLIENPDATKH